MSRHLIIRCDRDGCTAQTETRASDTAPTTIGVPSGWLTLVTEGIPDKHYCSLLCMIQAHLPAQPAAATSQPSAPATIAASPYATPAMITPAAKPITSRRGKKAQ